MTTLVYSVYNLLSEHISFPLSLHIYCTSYLSIYLYRDNTAAVSVLLYFSLIVSLEVASFNHAETKAIVLIVLISGCEFLGDGVIFSPGFLYIFVVD